MRLATFNLLHGRSLTDGLVDPDRLAAAVTALDADVLALQEVDRDQSRSGNLDLTAIAALLTLVGYSVSDTIVVFDRIRENSHLMKGATNGEIINKSVNDTLSRTIMTSLTVFLTILILFLVGGEVTKGFAFAMLIGVITGTYSSIFVAAPFLVDFAKRRPLGGDAKDAVKPAVKNPKATAQKA